MINRHESKKVMSKEVRTRCKCLWIKRHLGKFARHYVRHYARRYTQSVIGSSSYLFWIFNSEGMSTLQ